MALPARAAGRFRFAPGLQRLEDRSVPATITVTTLLDTIAVDGAVSLREAITSANNNADLNADVVGVGAYGADAINFNIPGAGPFSIAVTSALPALTDAAGVTIDGTTQPGFTATPIVELNGAGGTASGLVITSANNTIRGLVINRFLGTAGILVNGASATGNVIQGNYIGTDVTGTAALGNNSGVILTDSHNNTIGGTASGMRNIISGNTFFGIQIQNGTGNTLQGNYIGTDATGTADLGNTSSGVFVESSQNTTIGGTAAGARNVISGNNNNGVFVQGGSGNTLVGNYIGTDATGSVALGNSSAGVLLTSSTSNNVIGGTTAAARNVISGNQRGVSISDGTGNTVQGNYLGTNAGGTAAVPNGTEGVRLANGANNNTIGGTAAGAGNLISGNTKDGVLFAGPATGNVLQGNFIGTDAAGTSGIPNTGNGVAADFTNANNTIGGTAAGAGNRIAFNREQGVSIGRQLDAQQISVLGNSIFSNRTLGIDLGGNGVTANDAGDADGGPNGKQNYPVISSVVGNQIFGSLNSTPNTSFRLEFFSNAARDASGFGEGQTFLGFLNVTTDASGNAPFTFTAPSILLGLFTTATATSQATNDTSEFSNAVLGLAPPTATPTLTPALVPVQVPPAIPQAVPQAVPVLNTPLVPAGVTPSVTAGNISPTAGAQAALTPKAALAVAQGLGGTDLVRIFNTDGTFRSEFAAFPGFLGGVRLGTADVNDDGFPDVIAGAGVGAPNGHVKVFSGLDGSLLRSFFAFDSFAGGLNVAGGDINGDGFADIIVGTAAGAAHVKVFDGQSGTLLTSFFAYAPTFVGGVTVGAADFNNDGLADVVTGAGPGAPPHVKVLEATSLGNVQANGQIADTAALASFFAFAPAFTGGVFVTAGADFDADGIADLVVGAGPGAGPHVKVLSGARLTQLNSDNTAPDALAVASFLAFDARFRGGVRVGEADADGNGTVEIVIGAGPGADPDVRLLGGSTFTDVRRFDAFAVGFAGGVFVD